MKCLPTPAKRRRFPRRCRQTDGPSRRQAAAFTIVTWRAAFQRHGRSSWSWLILVRPETMRSSTSQRLCLGLPHGAPDVRRLAANAIFDGVELADATYRLGRDRRSGRDMDVIELATRMGEAKCKRHGAARPRRIEQAIVASVTVDLQNAVEPREQVRRALALAIFGEHIHDSRWRRSVPWPVIHGRHP